MSIDMKSLDGAWSLMDRELGAGFREGLHEPDSVWDDALSAIVPGEVHLDLMRHGKMEEPLYGRNAPACAWVEEREWWFRRDFTVDRPPEDRVELVCEGLDTTAALWLNGKQIGSANNAFIPHRFEVTKLLQAGVNTLVIRLDSGAVAARQKPLKKFGKGASESIWVRKPQFSFGWDWAPRLVNCGIWRPVRLEFHRESILRELWIRTRLAAGNHAEIEVVAEIENGERLTGRPALQLTIPGVGEQRVAVSDAPGLQRVSATIHARHPRLWWPHPLGEPHLYTLQARLTCGKAVLDRREQRFGIREIRLLEEPQDGRGPGKTFTLLVNGEKFFANGANWAPPDCIVARVTPEKYEALLRLAREANINMFRVWGGGIYEDERFYRFCDENGILIWQDFMFACFVYPGDDPDFRRAVELEVEAAVRLLRNHPCIALWCGSNESDWAFESNWYAGVERNYSVPLEYELIPRLLAVLDPDRPYRPTSPWGGREANDEDEGDQHWWSISIATGGNDTLDYRHYRRAHCTFNSEYGYFGMPPIASMQAYLPEAQRHPGSEFFRYHTNRHGFTEKGAQGGLKVMAAVDALVADASGMALPELVEASQLLQAEALKTATEQGRRRKFACGGSMFWMFSDAWGEVGWSIVDYYLRAKAAYYYIKRAYAPILVSIKEEENGVSVWVINDTLKPFKGKLECALMSFEGKQHTRVSVPVEVPPNASVCCAKERMTLMRSGDFYLARLSRRGRVMGESTFFFMNFRSMKLPPARVCMKTLRKAAGRAVLELSSDSFAHFVRLSLPEGLSCDDQFFDILPGSRRRVEVTGDLRRLVEVQVCWRNKAADERTG